MSSVNDDTVIEMSKEEPSAQTSGDGVLPESRGRDDTNAKEDFNREINGNTTNSGPTEIDDISDDGVFPNSNNNQPRVDDELFPLEMGGDPNVDYDGKGGNRNAPGINPNANNNAPEVQPGVETRITPDVNVYQQKKNLAQGMMDLALFSANASQLRYVLEARDVHPYFYLVVIFILTSLVLQIAVGVGLILNSRYNVKEYYDICKADRINDFTVIGVFLITIVNVFIASFGVATTRIVSPS